jgi:hypothetical protein
MSASNANNEEEVVIYVDSFFIPHVFDYISLDKLVEIIEENNTAKGNGETSIGKVEKIESIPKTNQKDGHAYYSCFVELKSWSNNKYAMDLRDRLYNNEQCRVYYNRDLYYHKGNYCNKQEYIVILPNKSDTFFLDAPTHADLVLYLHPDVRLETVYNVMEGLDFGKVRCIEAEAFQHYPNESNTYVPNNIWKWGNPDIWAKKVNVRHNVIYVRFDYWYKTQTAYNFKKEIKDATFVDIPVFDGTTWTFFETAPKYEGVNPYVWKR